MQFTKDALLGIFGNSGEGLFNDFIKMLLLDAFIGCNDRHMYNWGVVRNINGLHEPYFSPIYDSARSLFWNETEDKLKIWHQSKTTQEQMIKTYSEKSSAKTGVEAMGKVNHFELVKQIVQRMFAEEEMVNQFFSAERFDMVKTMIIDEFSDLISELRLEFILGALEYRKNKFSQILV